MKLKLITGVLFITTSLFVKAQEYVPMLDSFNEWKFTTCNFGCITDTYFTDGDTLVGGESFKILDGYHYISRGFLLREDVAEKKVYIKIILPNRVENYLLYDFSLSEGDTFEMFNPITPFPEEGGMFLLDSIRSRTLVDGEAYRHFYFSPAPGNTASTENAVWIEGIGSLSILTAPGGYPDINDVGHLSCAYKAGNHVYENLDSIAKCVPDILSIPSNKDTNWNLTLYQEENNIVLKKAIGVTEVLLFDISGKKNIEIFNQSQSESIFVDTTSLQQGVYILKVLGTNGKTKTFKLLKK